ncbi:serine hydrolase [Paenibacillus silvae]|uniref:serine hydrolase n=1 Tax=Paenibacillus silvae TaxID=1325358 RepID=UPI003CE6D1DE
MTFKSTTETTTTATPLHNKLEGLDNFVTKQLEQWKGVGTAVAVIHKDQVIWSKGYGYRDLEKKLKVTSDTLFAIGSSTKAFTATAAAQLVDEGLLDWDQPVKSYLQDFQMFDPVATDRLTMRDMLCHRSGLPRHEMVWYNSPRSREELVHSLRYLEPNQNFRSKWQYQNLMYMTAGYLIGHLKGTSWEQVVQDQLLTPLGMNSSLFTVQEMQEQADYALPYMEQEGQNVSIPFRVIDTIGPAGSINSNLKDMTAWLQLQIQHGKWQDKALVSTEQIAEIHRPQMVSDSPFHSKELPVSTYGLGWMIEPYRGHAMIHHGGAIDGFASQVAFLPDEQIGIVVLSNTNGSVIPYTVAFYIMDCVLGLEPKDWTSTLLKLMGQGEQEAEQPEQKQLEETLANGEAQAEEETKPEKTSAPLPLDAPASTYTGIYQHPGYGELLVHETDQGLQTRFNNIDMPMQYVGKHTFSVSLVLFGLDMDFTFEVSEDQPLPAASVSAPLVPEANANPIVFTRIS